MNFVFFDPKNIKQNPIPQPSTSPQNPPSNKPAGKGPNKQKTPKQPPAGPPNVSPNFPNQPGGNMQNGTNQLPPQRQKEYVPQDMKKDIESKETPDGYWQVDPPLDGYYYATIDSYYDHRTMLWSTRENYGPYNPKLN